jgi:hypothetical protein
MRLPFRRAPKVARTLTPLAVQIAEQTATNDRALLRRLLEERRVWLSRKDIPSGMRREAKAFIADIGDGRSPRNLAIRPKRKKAKR